MLDSLDTFSLRSPGIKFPRNVSEDDAAVVRKRKAKRKLSFRPSTPPPRELDANTPSLLSPSGRRKVHRMLSMPQKYITLLDVFKALEAVMGYNKGKVSLHSASVSRFAHPSSCSLSLRSSPWLRIPSRGPLRYLWILATSCRSLPSFRISILSITE